MAAGSRFGVQKSGRAREVEVVRVRFTSRGGELVVVGAVPGEDGVASKAGMAAGVPRLPGSIAHEGAP